MQKINLTVELANSRELTHEERHEFLRHVVRILAQHRLIEAGDAIVTDCGFGLELPKQEFIPTEIEVSNSIWGGPN